MTQHDEVLAELCQLERDARRRELLGEFADCQRLAVVRNQRQVDGDDSWRTELKVAAGAVMAFDLSVC